MEKIELLDDVFYIENKTLHREEGPAIIFKNGNEWWVKNGELHRENGPAIIDGKEIIEYWLNGEPATPDEIKNIKRNKWIDKIL